MREKWMKPKITLVIDALITINTENLDISRHEIFNIRRVNNDIGCVFKWNKCLGPEWVVFRYSNFYGPRLYLAAENIN